MINKKSNLSLLIILGIIWSTFAIFTKNSSLLSPYFVSFVRLFIASVFLYFICLFQNEKIFVKENYFQYLIVGIFNSALPFTLFAFSTKQLESSIVAILDGTVPMFEVLISILILKKQVSKKVIFGIFSGIVGVVLTSIDSMKSQEISLIVILSILYTLIATCSYAGASIYINTKCKNIKPMAIATGSVIVASLILSPSIFFTNFSLIDSKIAYSLFGLGFLCTGLAYVIYFKIATEETPRFAVSVVLLIPIFGTIFGAIFLGEAISMFKIAGCMMILTSMKFILDL